MGRSEANDVCELKGIHIFLCRKIWILSSITPPPLCCLRAGKISKPPPLKGRGSPFAERRARQIKNDIATILGEGTSLRKTMPPKPTRPQSDEPRWPLAGLPENILSLCALSHPHPHILLQASSHNTIFRRETINRKQKIRAGFVYSSEFYFFA